MIKNKMNEAKDCTKTLLIETGAKLFGTLGFEAVTVRQATNIVGVNVSCISYYFESKIGYYQAVIDYLIHRLINQLEDFDVSEFEHQDLDSMRTQLKQMVVYFHDFCMSNEGMYLSNIFLRESVTNNTGHASNGLAELIVFIHEHFEKILTIYYTKLGEPDTDVNFVTLTMLSIVQKMSGRECKPLPAIEYLGDNLFEKLIDFILFKRF